MHNATTVLPFKMRSPTRRHYFLRVNFRPFSFFTRTTRAKINPENDISLLHRFLNWRKPSLCLAWLLEAVNEVCSSDVQNRLFHFGSVLQKNSDLVRNEFGSVRFKKCAVPFGYYSYLLLV